MSYNTLTVETNNHVAEVVLNRPETGNALSIELFEEIYTAFSYLDTEPEVRVIILRASGNAFSYGLDLKDTMQQIGHLFQGGLAKQRTEFLEVVRKLQRSIFSIRNCRKPVIAAIHGWCIGGGLDLISACDVRYCSEDAKFSLREARMGIVADLGSLQYLPGIIGDAATRELALTAKDIGSERAKNIGLVTGVLSSSGELLEHVQTEAKEIAKLPPLVVQGAKQVLNYQDGKSISDALEYVATWNSAFIQSEDFAEAMTAFIEKREPNYKGA